MLFTWKLVMIVPTTTVWANATPKAQIVVNNETTKEQICIDFLWENVKKLANITPASQVEVNFISAINIWTNGAIFNRISGKDIKIIDDNLLDDLSPIE